MKLNHKAMAVEALKQSQLMAMSGLWVCALGYAEEALECARMHGDRTLRGHCAYVVECLHKLQPAPDVTFRSLLLPIEVLAND